ncbi:hypothetical protein VPH35_106498 [Triticum aestivum]|uniref:Uncharacterized protein n=1 Tax=Triticum aestivum TaxID=4565 RepID=A0A3B6NWC2_WHEAT
MVLALVMDLAVVMDKGNVIIEECLDTSMDHFRMAASQPNKPTMKEDGEDEMAGWWEKAAKKLREEDAAKLKKKKEEELEEKRKEEERASNAMRTREQALVRKCEEAQKKRQKDFEEGTMKLWAIAAEKKEREDKIFMERVVKEAHLIRKREEEEEEERKKKKGKGPCSTQ